MILVDASVWIAHLKRASDELTIALEEGIVCCHPFTIGEVALGSLRNRAVVVEALADLPRASVASEDEMRTFIESNRLYGQGIGYIDAHLLASCRIDDAHLWTYDKALATLASELRVVYRT